MNLCDDLFHTGLMHMVTKH